MISPQCTRLAEVELCISEVSEHAVGDRCVHHSHFTRFHLWWASLSLAACRVLLVHLLLPGLRDGRRPEEFNRDAEHRESTPISGLPTDLAVFLQTSLGQADGC